MVPRRYFGQLLTQKMQEKIPVLRERIKKLQKEKGDIVIGQYTISQVIQGMKGINCMLYFCSSLDPDSGITFRNMKIKELCAKLPQVGGQPVPEALFWLLLTNELPSSEEFKEITADFTGAANIPASTIALIKQNAKFHHPMTMLSLAVLDMQKQSEFRRLYSDGKVTKENYWVPTLDDSLSLIRSLPQLAGLIYTTKYDKKGVTLDTNDWAGHYVNHLGFNKDEKIMQVIRGSLVVHADHEGGNVSAHTGFLISSALSDPYYSISGMINGLAGPLHGLANQEVMKFVQEAVSHLEKKGFAIESVDRTQLTNELETFIRQWLRKSVLPGYGHGKLRKIDPRYTHFKELSLQMIPKNKYVIVTHAIEEVATKVLTELGKVKNPFPNIDAHSGVMLYTTGIKEFEYYTVIFAMSRALGVLANIILARAVGLNIERPGSLTIEDLERIANKASNDAPTK